MFKGIDIEDQDTHVKKIAKEIVETIWCDVRKFTRTMSLYASAKNVCMDFLFYYSTSNYF